MNIIISGQYELAIPLAGSTVSTVINHPQVSQTLPEKKPNTFFQYLVNGSDVSLDYRLMDGDLLEILEVSAEIPFEEPKQCMITVNGESVYGPFGGLSICRLYNTNLVDQLIEKYHPDYDADLIRFFVNDYPVGSGYILNDDDKVVIQYMSKESNVSDLLTYTVVDPTNAEETQISITHYEDKSAAIEIPKKVLIGQNQLSELGWLLIAMAGGTYDGDDCAELLDGYGLEIPIDLEWEQF